MAGIIVMPHQAQDNLTQAVRVSFRWLPRLQGIVDTAMKKVEAQGHSITTVLVYDHVLAAKRETVAFTQGRDVWWQDEVPKQPTTCPVEWMGAEEPLFKVSFLWTPSLLQNCLTRTWLVEGHGQCCMPFRAARVRCQRVCREGLHLRGPQQQAA